MASPGDWHICFGASIEYTSTDAGPTLLFAYGPYMLSEGFVVTLTCSHVAHTLNGSIGTSPSKCFRCVCAFLLRGQLCYVSLPKCIFLGVWQVLMTWHVHDMGMNIWHDMCRWQDMTFADDMCKISFHEWITYHEWICEHVHVCTDVSKIWRFEQIT